MFLRHRRGFTLIELMVAVVVIGVLAGAASVSYGRFAHGARATSATATAGAILSAISSAAAQQDLSPADLVAARWQTGGAASLAGLGIDPAPVTGTYIPPNGGAGYLSTSVDGHEYCTMALPDTTSAPPRLVSCAPGQQPIAARPAYENLVLATGPVAFWPMPETSGASAAALAGPDGTYSAYGTIGAGPFPGTAGHSNRLYAGDGFFDHTGTDGSFTFAAWGQLSTWDNTTAGYNWSRLLNRAWVGDGALLYVGAPPSSGPYRYIMFGTARAGTQFSASARILSDDNWHLFVGVHDNSIGTNRIYMDGTLLAEVPAPADSGTDTSRYFDTEPNPAASAVSEVAVWNRPLTAGEVAALYAAR